MTKFLIILLLGLPLCVAEPMKRMQVADQKSIRSCKFLIRLSEKFTQDVGRELSSSKFS